MIGRIVDWFLGDDAKMIIPFFTVFILLIPMIMWRLIDPETNLPLIGIGLGIILNLIPLILSAKRGGKT